MAFNENEELNDNVINYLNHYLSEKNNTDYAVQLVGPWDSGKTHFIKSCVLVNNKYKSNPLYISLNGLITNAEITERLFFQVHPKLSSKVFKAIGFFISRVINAVAGTDVTKDTDAKYIIKDFILNVEKRILIFDDLERCLIPIQSVLGYINSFVEHKACKVIIIASENDFTSEQKEQYVIIKEKVVGKTLSLTPSIEQVIEVFSQQINNELARSYIKKNKDLINDIIKMSGSVNFRSVRAIFDDYERLISLFCDYFQTSTIAADKLLSSMLALGIEIRSGRITYEEVIDLPTNSLIHALSKTKTNGVINTIDKYKSLDWFDPVIPYKTIAFLYSSGVIDINNIKCYLSQHPLFINDNARQFWRELWSWSDLTRTRFLFAQKGLKKQLEKCEIIEPEVIMHVVGIVLSLEENNDISLTSGEDIKDFFYNYIDEIKKRKLLLPKISFFSDSYSSVYGLGFISSEKNTFKEIRCYLKGAVHYRLNDSLKKTYPDLLHSFSLSTN
ncbi:P-loop NTPase fold protein, partial [Enterobacter hormaechei]